MLSDKAVLIGDSIGALSNKVDGVAISLADVTTAAANGINNNINGLSATTVQIQADLETLALSSPEGLADRMAVIETKLSNLPATVQEQLGIDLGPDVTDEVLDGLSEIKKVVADQKNQLSLFGDGSPGDGCYNTRFEMKSFVTNLALISSMLQSVGESSIDFDVGDSSVIDNVPCKILYGVSIAFQQTRMSDLVLKLEEAAAALETLIPLFVQTIEGESLSPILHSDSCETIVTPPYRGVITGAAGALNAVSIPLQIWAAKVDTETFTGFSDIRKLAPITKEVSGGVWGFANITLSREKSGHKLANGLNAVAKGLDALASSATNKIFKCSVTHNQSEIWAKLEMLEAESRIVKSQVCSMSRSRVEGC